MEARRLLYWFSAFLLLCLMAFLYQTSKDDAEKKPIIESQIEITPKEKPIPAKDRFSIVMMSDIVDSSNSDIVDVNGDELVIGDIYLQSKTDAKLYPISDTLSIYQEIEYALIIDNKEERSIKVRGEDGFFFIQGLILLPDAGKEVVLDSFDNYHVVMNY